MADIRIDQVADTLSSLGAGDFLLVRSQPSGPTAKIAHPNEMPRKGILPTLAGISVNQANDTIWVWDDTDDLPKEVAVRDIVFGNFGNINKTANFTLALTDAIQALEIRDSVSTITLDGNVANIGGSDFLIQNFRTTDITVQSANINMFVDGAIVTSATVRQHRAASITVSNGAGEAIFSGG